MRKILAAAAIVVFAVPAVSFSQEVGRDQETWTWTGRVESGKWFRVASVNGPVTIEASSDNMVHVRAEKEVREGSVRDVAFHVLQEDGNVTICALWRNSVCEDGGLRSRRSDNDEDQDRRNRRDVRVKFTVRLPAGVRVSAGTVNGELRVSSNSSEVRASSVNGGVEVSNATGPVRATTVNGGVEVATRNGPVDASTVNGDIHVKMSALSRGGDMRFNTVNGSITVETPASLDAVVDMETMHGSLSSDYPVQLEGRFGPRRARGTTGRGGRRIEMDTLNGSVELRKAR